MSKKINRKSKDPMKKKETTTRVDAQINKRFRIICLILDIGPKEQLEDLMTQWADQNHKKISPEKLDKVVG